MTLIHGNVRGMGSDGVRISGSQARVDGLHVSDNGGDGLFAGWRCVVTRSTASRNGGDGIETADDCTISKNIATENDETGISTGVACTVIHNTSNKNESGFLARGGSNLIGNTAFDNSGLGMNLNQRAGYAQNVLSSNNGNSLGSETSPEVSGGVETGKNLCGRDTVCP